MAGDRLLENIQRLSGTLGFNRPSPFDGRDGEANLRAVVITVRPARIECLAVTQPWPWIRFPGSPLG
jgi:hypothetical protein